MIRKLTLYNYSSQKLDKVNALKIIIITRMYTYEHIRMFITRKLLFKISIPEGSARCPLVGADIKQKRKWRYRNDPQRGTADSPPVRHPARRHPAGHPVISPPPLLSASCDAAVPPPCQQPVRVSRPPVVPVSSPARLISHRCNLICIASFYAALACPA